MEILINGMPAALKKGTSFDYVLENRYFSGVDDYTLSIEFPMKDCITNQRIFGRINTHEAKVPNTLYHCVISSGTLHFEGVLKIVSTSDVSVKGQFMAGRTAENYASSFDDIIINTLNLPWPTFDILHDSDFVNPDPEVIARKYGYNKNLDTVAIQRQGYVTLPWVNNTTGILQNKPGNRSYTPRPFDNSVEGLSVQPFLWYLLEQIFEAIGYTANLNAIKGSQWTHLLVCNALPYVWDVHDFSRALPSWSLTKLLEQVEYLLNGEFSIDHIHKTVDFQFCSTIVNAAGQSNVETIFNTFDSDEEDADSCKYRNSVRLKYAELEHNMQKIYSCNAFIQDCIKNGLVNEFTSLDELVRVIKEDIVAVRGSESTNRQTAKTGALVRFKSTYRDILYAKILYCAQNKSYYIPVDFTVKYTYHHRSPNYHSYDTSLSSLKLMQINVFEDSGDGEEYEMGIVPTWIDRCFDSSNNDLGECIFLEPGDYSEPVPEEETDYEKYWTLIKERLDSYEENGGLPEYNTNLFVAFWKGLIPMLDPNKLFCPAITNIPLFLDYVKDGYPLYAVSSGLSLQLRSPLMNAGINIPNIDQTRKYKFQWLSNSLPKVESVFIIHGRKFMCSKITATFTEDGMSQKLKGEFYRVID